MNETPYKFMNLWGWIDLYENQRETIPMLIQRLFNLEYYPDYYPLILKSAAFYQFVYLISRSLSKRWFKSYNQLSLKDQRRWGVKVVSLVNAILVCCLSFPILRDHELALDPVFGTNDYSRSVYSFACGYFLWDIIYVLYQRQDLAFLLHGVACFIVYLFSLTPFLNFYGAAFLFFELSTPFLDMIYFLDKSGNSQSLIMVINGLCLIVSFFLARIVFGFYMSYHTFASIFKVIENTPNHLIVIYGIANIALNLLNVFWFYKMVTMFIRRYKQAYKTKKD